MTVDEQYKLSAYKEVSVLLENPSKKICVVMDEVTNKLCMKKVLSGTDQFDFYARLASLEHKNIIKIHDVIYYDGATHIFEEYITGQTLQALLENEGVQPESKAADYIMQICDALIYLHSQHPPIIHRDIKPENIMLSADGLIKLVDFDIAREFKQSAKRDTIFMGTKEYAAPEQYGYKQTDGRTDIYAIGVLLHELLTGELPQNNIMYNGTSRKIILKCLQLEPKQRYQSVSALKKALVNTMVNRYKKIGICSLSAILAIVTMIVLFPKISGYLYGMSNVPSVSMQPVTEQHFDDIDNLEPDAPSSMQPVTEQNSDDIDNPEPGTPPPTQPALEQNPDNIDNPEPGAPPPTQPALEQNPDDIDNPESSAPTQPTPEQNPGDIDNLEPGAQPPTQPVAEQKHDDLYNPTDPDGIYASRTILGQRFYDIAHLFIKVYDFEEKPTIILENEGINKIVRSITGDYYDSVARAFQDYDDSYWKAFYDYPNNLCAIVTCKFEEGAKRYDRLLFEIGGKHMNITYYDSNLETTFYFTTNDNKGLLSENAFQWMKHYLYMRESLLVFDEAPVTDITGIYYVGHQKKIEIFEEAGEMKFSYTDIKRSKEAEPLIVEAIHKLDNNHYWIKTFTGYGKEMLIFNFSKKNLTLLHELKDSDRDLVYDIGGQGVTTSIDPRGLYTKS